MIVVVNDSGRVILDDVSYPLDPSSDLIISDGGETIAYLHGDEYASSYYISMFRLTGGAPESSPIDTAVSLSYVSGNFAECAIRLQDSTGAWRNATTSEVSGGVVRLTSIGK